VRWVHPALKGICPICNGPHPVVGADYRAKCTYCEVPLELVRNRGGKVCLACEKRAENGLCLTCGAPLVRIQDTGRTRCVRCGVPSWPADYVEVTTYFAGKKKIVMASPHARIDFPPSCAEYGQRLGPLSRSIDGLVEMRLTEVEFYRGNIHRPVAVRGVSAWPNPWEDHVFSLGPSTLHTLWDLLNQKPLVTKSAVNLMNVYRLLGVPDVTFRGSKTWERLEAIDITIGSRLWISDLRHLISIAFPDTRGL
jgi:hypothetical protein